MRNDRSGDEGMVRVEEERLENVMDFFCSKLAKTAILGSNKVIEKA